MPDIDLGYHPHKYQLAIHRKARRFTVVVAHRRFGKTYCAVATLVDAAITTGMEDARFGYLAPFLKQAKGVAWDYLRRFSLAWPGTKVNEGELSVDFPNGARIRLFGGDNADAMRGLYFDGVVIDEMADLKPDVIGSVVRPALADRKGWAFFIGTPKGYNLFSELYNSAASGVDPEWAAMMFRSDETNLIDADELLSARAFMSDAQFRQEFLCDFAAASDNVLITIDEVAAAVARVGHEHELEGFPRILGVDVARFGNDRSVIQRRQGLGCLEPLVFSGIDNMELARRVAACIVEWKPDAVFIDAGRGEGVIDRLRQLHYAVTEVNFGGTPLDRHYADRRSEMWDGIKGWLASGGLLPNNLALKTDLCVPGYAFDSAGRMKLESKDAIKARGMRSPDVADALALTFAMPVPMPLSSRAALIAKYSTRRAYNPHAEAVE